MLPYIHKYVLCCQTCQSRRDKDPITGVHYARIPVNFRPLSRMSMDVKHMMPSKFGYNHILLCTCEISGYVIGIPIQDCTSITIFEAIFFKICCIFGKPKTLIFDEGAGFTSKLMKELLSYLRIENFVILPYNHGSNKTERYIRTINDMICKYLTGTGDLWPLYVYPACYSMNTFVNYTGYCAYEMIFLKQPPSLLDFELDPIYDGLSLPAKEYLKLMENRFNLMKKIILDQKVKDQLAQYYREKRKYPNYNTFAVGDMVYLDSEYCSDLHTSNIKLKKRWIGPLKIQVVLDDSHYMISNWDGKVNPISMHANRLKPYNLNMGIISDGQLVSVNTVKQLFDHIRKMRGDLESSENNEENAEQNQN